MSKVGGVLRLAVYCATYSPSPRYSIFVHAAAIRKPIDATAISTMALLCFIWGFGHVAAKLAAPGISLVMQGGIRCAIAAVFLVGWARFRGTPLFGVIAGVVVLHEPLRTAFVGAVVLVGAGIYLVNRPGGDRARTGATLC
jgi:drug/metabolite transporter (DMT)-like permease